MAGAAKENFSLSDAADIIKSIDSAFAEASTSAVTAATEAEEARKNARAASELARRFIMSGSGHDISGSPSPSIAARNHTSPKVNSYTSVRSPTNYRATNGDSSFVSPFSASTDNAGSPGSRRSSGQSPKYDANAEEVVSLSLELDRVKHSIESEQMAHDETKSALTQSKVKNAQLEAQIERLLAEMETQRESNGRTIDTYEREAAHGRMRVEAAEEDAEAALVFAKESDQAREQVEELLTVALQELEQLRQEVASNGSPPSMSSKPAPPKRRPPPPPPPPPPRPESGDDSKPSPRVVRFADEPTILAESSDAPVAATPWPPPPPKSLVSSGRELLQRSIGSSSPDSSFTSDRSFESATERRQRLKDRLRSLNVHVELPTPSSVATAVSPAPPPAQSESVSDDTCRHAATLIQASGRRLNLSGRWWNEGAETTSVGAHLETLARHYCTSVEVLIDRKQKEIVELESLCALWERGNTADDNV